MEENSLYSVDEYNDLCDKVCKVDYYTFSEMTPKKIEWLWKPYIVKGNLNIIVGDGGVGKSYFTSWLLSAISNGDKIPFTEDNFVQGNCILENAEDDIEATTLPRLMAHNADTTKIGFFNEEQFVFRVEDYTRLENQLIKLRPEIVVLDPIQAYLEDVNMNSAIEVRSALKPLQRLAQEYNCAIVLIMHMNKNTGTNKATNRVMGSYDFIATCRSAVLIQNNPNNPEEKLFIPIKGNLLKESEKNTLSYKINDNGQIEWLENKGRINPDEILAETNNFIDKSSNAKGFIIGALSRGEIKSNELKELIMNIGNITEKTYNISKASLHKENVISNFQKDKTFYWKLNDSDSKQ